MTLWCSERLVLAAQLTILGFFFGGGGDLYQFAGISCLLRLSQEVTGSSSQLSVVLLRYASKGTGMQVVGLFFIGCLLPSGTWLAGPGS